MNKKQSIFNPKNIFRLFLGIIVIITISCEHEPSSLGSNFLPGNITYRYDTSFEFTANVYEEEPFNTTNISNYSLGIINDEYFGTFKAEYAGQFTPSTYYTKDSTITTFNVDSIRLVIAIDSIYGFHDGNLKFNVYELNKEIDDTYNSDVNISDFYSTDDKISTNSWFSGDSLIVIRLSDEFADKLIPDSQEDTIYKNSANFISVFKGIAIIPELLGSYGEVIDIDILSEETEILMHYGDTLSYSYDLGKTTIRKFAHYSNDITGAVAEDYITNDENENDELLFLQGITNLGSNITFSNIGQWFDDDSAFSVINAELLIPVFKDDNFEVFYPPNKLYLKYEYADSAYAFITDYYDFLDGRGIFDGNYDEENEHYRFFIPKHLMQVLNRDIDNYELNLNIVNKSIYPHRVILKTGENIKLKVTYTKH